jgi:predicted amidohydrolase
MTGKDSTPAMPVAACIQMRSGADPAANLAAVDRLLGEAARGGACFAATPENTTFLGRPEDKLRIAEPIDGPCARGLGEMAARHRLWLLVGSVPERLDGRRTYNTSLLFDDTGALVAFYRKIHLFDVDVPGAAFTESAHVAAGDQRAVPDTPIGRLGLSICYDVRFGEHYRALVADGAEVLAVPSAFTVPTGEAHWHVLLRARAIESQAWVLAPAQEGEHGAGRHSFGHSLIADPWGRVVAERREAGEGVVLAEVDLAKVAETRRRMPVVAAPTAATPR